MNVLVGYLKSRTFWGNLIVAVLAIIDESTVKLVPAEYKALVVLVLNMILRALTGKPLTEK